MMQVVRMETKHYCPISDKVQYLLDEKQDMLSGPFSERCWFIPMAHMQLCGLKVPPPTHTHIHTALIHMHTWHSPLTMTPHTTPSTIFIEQAIVLSKIVLWDAKTQTINYFDCIQTLNFDYLLDTKKCSFHLTAGQENLKRNLLCWANEKYISMINSTMWTLFPGPYESDALSCDVFFSVCFV
jgi:hypothetical protein